MNIAKDHILQEKKMGKGEGEQKITNKQSG